MGPAKLPPANSDFIHSPGHHFCFWLTSYKLGFLGPLPSFQWLVRMTHRTQGNIYSCLLVYWKGYSKGWASLMTQMVKNLLAMRETWLWSLGWKDPLEKRMSTLSSTLAWRIQWTEEPGGLQSMGLQRVGPDWVTFSLSKDTDEWPD